MFLAKGMFEELSGKFIVRKKKVNDDPRPGARSGVGGMTRIESVYLAVEMDPANQYCVDIVRNGIDKDNVIQLHLDTPDGCCAWVKDTANSFHLGGGILDFDTATTSNLAFGVRLPDSFLIGICKTGKRYKHQ
jgi:hypothetical protein